MTQPIQSIPKYEDNPNITETFVDGTVGANFVNGNLHVTFFTIRTDHSEQPTHPNVPPPQVRRVALRLVLPIAGAIDLQTTMGNILQILRDQRLIQTIPIISGPQTRQ